VAYPSVARSPEIVPGISDKSFSQAHIVELIAKGTIRNKEIISRNHYQFLNKSDIDSYKELIELWILEYAEKYSSD
jgi:hypothetical protein